MKCYVYDTTEGRRHRRVARGSSKSGESELSDKNVANKTQSRRLRLARASIHTKSNAEPAICETDRAT